MVFWLTVWVEPVAQFIWQPCSQGLSSSVHLAPRGKNSLEILVPKCFKCYFNILKTGLRVFTGVVHWATTETSKSREKSCTVSSRRWRPANRNIIQRSFFANIYHYWQERQFTCLRGFTRIFSPCGSDIYRGRVIPFLLKRHSHSKEASAESMSTKQSKSLLSSFASTV